MRTSLQETVRLLNDKLDQRTELDKEIDELRGLIGTGSVSSMSDIGNGRRTGKKRGPKPGRAAALKAAKAAAKTTGKGETTRRGRAPKGKLTCSEAIEHVLRKNPKGLKLDELTKAVIKAGFKTESKQPATVVYQAIHNLQDKVTRGDDHKYSWAA